jgi:hypothetical protein
VINGSAPKIRRQFQKNIGRRFKNAGGATDRVQKSDNVEIDDSAKIAGREIGPAQPFDRNESSMRAMRMSKIGVSARCSCIFPAAIVFSGMPAMPSACTDRCRTPPLHRRNRQFLPATRQKIPPKILKNNKKTSPEFPGRIVQRLEAVWVVHPRHCGLEIEG